MSAVHDSQTVEPEEFTPLLDYQFSGNDVTVRNKRALIENLRRKAVIYLAAQAVGINKLTVYRWRDADPQFAEAMAEAMQDAKEIMENSVYEDALNGNTLLKMFWLKRHDPSYRDKVTLDIQTVQDEIQERIKLAGLADINGLNVLDSSNSTQSLPQPVNQQKEDN
jgi:hypothetical protein